MKKIVAASAALIAALVVAGCSSAEESPPQTEPALDTISSRVQAEAVPSPEEEMVDGLMDQGVFLLPDQAASYAEAICDGGRNEVGLPDLLRIAVESWDTYDVDDHKEMILASIETHCPEIKSDLHLD